MLLFALVVVFIAGLMVGRTPEYLGKKIQSAEVKMAVLALLVVPATILVLTSVAAALPAGRDGLSNGTCFGSLKNLRLVATARISRRFQPCRSKP